MGPLKHPLPGGHGLQAPSEMKKYIGQLLPALLRTLSDDSDDVVLMNLKVSPKPP